VYIGGDRVTKNELLSKIYNYPLNNKFKMGVKKRCDLQKLLKEAVKYEWDGRDSEIINHHYESFEDDIILMFSDYEMKIAQELAIIAMAGKRIGEKIGVEVN
jgi:hypothetical protein